MKHLVRNAYLVFLGMLATSCAHPVGNLEIITLSGPASVRLGDKARVELWAGSTLGPNAFGNPRFYKEGSSSFVVSVSQLQGLSTLNLSDKAIIAYKKYSLDIEPTGTGSISVRASTFDLNQNYYFKDYAEKTGVSQRVSSISIHVTD